VDAGQLAFQNLTINYYMYVLHPTPQPMNTINRGPQEHKAQLCPHNKVLNQVNDE
jgi:hypothetical protein